MTVTSLVQTNIIHRGSSVYKEEILQKKKVRRFLAMFLILSMIVAMFLYVLQVNSIASKGYKIRGLKKQIEKLEDRNRVLQIDVSNLKSMSNLQLRSESFNMVKAQNIDYVVLPLTSVVAEK